MGFVNIWLDDLRPAPKGFEWAKSVDELILLWNKCESNGVSINTLSLDHDLGDDLPTGYDFTKWLVEEWYYHSPMCPKNIYLHTANPVGRENMCQLLTRHKPNGTKIHRSPIPFE